MNYEHGQEIKCRINGVYCEGKITIQYGSIFICQNSQEGSYCDDRQGYLFSWNINNGSPSSLHSNSVEIIELGGESTISVIKEELNYSDWEKNAIMALTNHEIPTDYFNQLEQERITNKKLLHEILGMNEDNNYRIIMKTNITEKQFRKECPKTTSFIEVIVNNLYPEAVGFDITKNQVHITSSQSKKLSKVITEWSTGTLWSDSNIKELYSKSVSELGFNSDTSSYISSLIDMCKGKNLVLSSNISDMLTSSTYCSFYSCYNMNGEFFNGNLSYIRDNFTLISFTYDSNIKRKVGRSWVYVLPEQYKILTPMRPYGSMYLLEYKLIRKYIQKCIGDYYKIRNYWKFIRNIEMNGDDFEHGRGAVYFDYDRVGMAYHKYKSNSEKPKLVFEPAMCLECGDDTYESSGGTCEDCDRTQSCSECGDRCTDGYTTVDGNLICENCFSNYYGVCSHCDEIYLTDDMHYSEEYENICPHCMEQHYTTCDDCGEIISNDDSVYLEDVDRTVCSYCADKYSECEKCGTVIHDDDMIRIDGEYYCSECVTECKECGDYIVVGNTLCDSCMCDKEAQVNQEEEKVVV
ncbi:MAG: hypothetical protein PHN69_03150 [Candidatus Pacebacteria bacterium]|nr:hypothetical protein [Candidatus Paceibacterota bacterium]